MPIGKLGLVIVFAAVILARCHSNAPTVNKAVQHGEEAAKAISAGRQALQGNQLDQADDALRQATNAVDQAKAAAAADSTPQAQQAAQEAQNQLAAFQALLREVQAARNAALAADAST